MGGRGGSALYVFEEFALWKRVLVATISVSRRDWIWRGGEVMMYGVCCRAYISELQKRG